MQNVSSGQFRYVHLRMDPLVVYITLVLNMLKLVGIHNRAVDGRGELLPVTTVLRVLYSLCILSRKENATTAKYTIMSILW